MKPITKYLLFLVLFSASQSSDAEAVKVETTIKSVKPEAKEITVTYKAGTTEKAITLDVSRKAAITLNGEKTDLESLGAGMAATVEYEKELAVVTKIEATGKKTVATAARPVLRLTLQLSEFGDGTIRLEKTSELPPDDFAGQSFAFSGLPHTKATKGEDGLFRLIHDFSDPDDLSAMTSFTRNAEIDKERGVLEFTPPVGNSQQQSVSTFGHIKALRTPITATCDILHSDGGLFLLSLGNELGMLQYRVTSKGARLDAPCDVQVAWLKRGSRALETLIEAKGVTPSQRNEQRFRLPLPNAGIPDPFIIYMNGTDQVKAVSRLEVRGHLVFSLGIEMDELQGMVFAKKILPNQVAERLGMLQGDVIAAINGNRPKSIAKAKDILNGLPIGEEAVITIQRGGKSLEFRVQAE